MKLFGAKTGSIGLTLSVMASFLLGAVAVSTAAPAAAATPAYNLAAVATHNVAATNCWVVISNGVYDLTVFATKHSGGASKITGQCGKDGTSTFRGQHGALTSSINTTVTGGATTFGAYLAQYKVGDFDNLAPSAPTALAGTPGDASAALTWTAPADAAATAGSQTASGSVSSGVVSYQIFQGATQVGTSTTTSYTATGLTNGTAYSFTVKAVDAAGNVSAASTAASVTPAAAVTIPAAPTGLTATAGNAQVVLSWTASAGATSYAVFNGATQIGTVTSPTVTYTATGLTNGTAYSFTVKAINIAGTSAASNTATATPVAPVTIPAAPTALTATAGNAQVVLSWTASAGATSYNVYQGATLLASQAGTTYTATGLTNGTAYSFTVTATNSAGTSAASNTATATPVAPVTIPAAPTGLTATAGDTTVALSWNASAGATSYQVFQGATQIISQVGTTYTVTGLTDGTAYTFTVKATNSAGTSAASTAATATPVDTTPPVAPTGLTATAGDTTVALAWSGPVDAASYQIFQGATLIGTQTGTTKTVTGLTDGTAYSFTVKAVDAAGNVSAASNTATATPVDTTPPVAPTGLTATAGNAQVVLSWSGPVDAATYQVYQGATLLGTQAGTARTVTGLTNGTAYSFTVKAVDAAGNVSAASNTATATPAVPADTTPPVAPTGLTATAGDTTVALAWSGPVDAATYQVFNGATLVASVTAPTTTYTVTGLTNGTAYSFTVKAVDAALNVSTASNTATATPVVAVPAAPTGLTATAGDTTVDLAWTASAKATSYAVFNGATQVGTTAGTTYTVTGLTNGTAYSFTVKAINSSGTSAASNTATATPVVAVPAAPTSLTATAGNAQVALSWTASAKATSYTVFQGATQIGTTATTAFTATGLTNGTAYSFTVKAVNSSGTSAASNTATATPADTTPPVAPTGLTATAGDTTVALAWSGPVDAASYQIFNGATLVATQAGTTYTVTGLTNGTAYSFTVKAVDAAGNVSVASNTATATPVVAVPAAPTGLTATAGDTTVALSWTASAKATSYQIFNGATLVATQAGTTYTVTGLTNGTAYSFTVKAGNSSGTSAASNTATATPADTTPPVAPSGLTASQADSATDLAWNGPADAATYRVFQDGVLIATQTGKTKTVLGLTNGSTYSFTVKAVDAAGNVSVASNTATVTPADTTPPAVPTALVVTAGDTTVDLAWSGPVDADKYNVYQDGVMIDWTNGTTYTVAGLTNGTTYTFGITAVDLAGNESAAVSATGKPAATVMPTTPVDSAALATHNSAANCWVAISGYVYDLTAFINTHSGGPAPIQSVCGKDGTALFTGQHGKALPSHLAVLAPKAVGTYTGAPATPGAGTYTKADIAKHNTPADCWVGIEGIVYDLTAFAQSHSGGASIILGVCGTDGTATFYSHHAPGSKNSNLAGFKVGTQSDYVAVTPPAPITVDALPGGGKYTMAEVKKHSTPEDCWTVINGGVYGLSTFISKHPGGTAPIAALCGVDGTGMYAGKHGGSGTAGAILAKLRMGDLVADPDAPAPTAPKTYTLADVAKHSTAADCWTIVNGYAYDVTAWIAKHPGGKDAIVAMCGKDGSASFNGMHSKSATAKAALDGYVLGAVTVDPTATPAPKPAVKYYTFAQVKKHAKITNCWTTVKGGVYDVTAWAKAHKSHPKAIAAVCGQNATAGYAGTARYAKVLPRMTLKKHRIGTLKATPKAKAPVKVKKK